MKKATIVRNVRTGNIWIVVDGKPVIDWYFKSVAGAKHWCKRNGYEFETKEVR